MRRRSGAAAAADGVMSTSQRLIDEPTVGAIAALILHQLYDTLEGAMDYRPGRSNASANGPQYIESGFTFDGTYMSAVSTTAPSRAITG